MTPIRVETDAWTLTDSAERSPGRYLYIPTVHPVGDRRVLRCAQTAIDAGYGVHFVWMGGPPGFTTHSNSIRETRIADALSVTDRLKALPYLFRAANQDDALGWHIHDFYMLPFAREWHRRTKRPVIYDVHEYYPEYYAERLRLTGPAQRGLSRIISHYETTSSHRIGGANVVSKTMATRFRSRSALVAVTPNYPLLTAFSPSVRPLTADRLNRVVHTGSLTPDYGSHTLVDMAVDLVRLDPTIEVLAIRRFPGQAAEAAFDAYVASRGRPKNLKLIDPMPAHQVPAFLESAGIGLSLMGRLGQNEIAVPSKLYEYTIAGLALVAPDMPGHANFMRQHAVGKLVTPSVAIDFASAVMELRRDPERIATEAQKRAEEARTNLTWEGGSSPELRDLLQTVIRR